MEIRKDRSAWGRGQVEDLDFVMGTLNQVISIHRDYNEALVMDLAAVE